MSEAAGGDVPVRAIIAGHGEFADGLVSAVDAITGRGGVFRSVSARGLSGVELEALPRRTIEETGATVVFTDLQAGSCTMAARRVLRDRQDVLFVAGAAPLHYQAQYWRRQAARAFAEERVSTGMASIEAHELIYQLEASRNYNPSPKLEGITAPMMWINSADDFINPRNLDVPKQAIQRMPNAKFRMIAESDDTRGHGTHTWAKFWKDDLAGLLARTN